MKMTKLLIFNLFLIEYRFEFREISNKCLSI